MMRCKKHFSDVSSTVGVCASCLRERLFSVIAAQSRAHVFSRSRDHDSVHLDDPMAAHPPDYPPPLVFPRSVSPYVAPGRRHDHRFYHTPQVQKAHPMTQDTCSTWAGGSKHRRWRRKFSFLRHFLIFRSRSNMVDLESADDRVSSGFDHDSPESTPSLFSLLKGRRKNRPPWRGNNTCYADHESFHRGSSSGMKVRATPDRELPPGSDGECWGGYSSERATPASATSTGRMRNLRSYYSSEVIGMRFCLSPLVRASPARRWRHPLEEGTCSVEVRLPPPAAGKKG